MNNQSIQEFQSFVSKLSGDEKGEAQLFVDRFFRAFGHGGIFEANGSLETRIKFSTGKTKFADCIWLPPKRPGVLIEMKKKADKNLINHFPQARDYWLEMNPEEIMGEGSQKPKYVILCNFETFIIYKDLSLVDIIKINDLQDRIDAFNFMLPEIREPIFKNNVEAISEEAAGLIGEFFKYLVFDLGEDREKTQRFTLQCVLSLFSEDFGLLPHGFFSTIIRDCIKGESSFDLLGNLFRQMSSPKMASGGRFKEIQYFNGGLFETVDPIDLDSKSLEILKKASDYNWKNVNPSIFGSLFESTMNSDERHAFGAHFTHETDILKIINPTIIRPWKKRIEEANTLKDLTILLGEISNYLVLDPACGCGNFLFVAYRSLKEIEFQIIEKIYNNFKTVKNLHLGISKVSIKQFHGIDIQPIAVEVAKMTMMIGKEILSAEWNEKIKPFNTSLGLVFDQGLPLDSLDNNIECKDSILNHWPEVDVIIGNPPYQSKNKMKQEMDNSYINEIRQFYPDIPGRADYCVYWFRKAHDHLQEGQYAGLVGTNTIRENNSRIGGLDYIINNGGTITDAVSSQVWSGDAAVHVSIVNWIKGNYNDIKSLSIQKGNDSNEPFEYFRVSTINSSLSNNHDVSSAHRLIANINSKKCYQGQTHGHEGFLLPSDTAINLISEDSKCKSVLLPYLTANELISKTDSLPNRYVIDFKKLDIFEAKSFSKLYSIIENSVYPERKEKYENEITKNKETLNKNPKAKVNHHHENFFKSWWKLSYPRDEMMQELSKIKRYIVCSQVTKRQIFEFVSSNINPNASLIVFPMDDDYSFGVLQSSIHWEWFKAKCSTLTERFRYTSDTVFDSFPWPQNPTEKNLKKISEVSVELRNLRREVMKEQNISLRELYRTMETTPNNPVSKMQIKLDEAVKEAYGMKKKDNILEFLLNLNEKLHENEINSIEITGPGLPQIINNKKLYTSNDCVSMI